MAEWTSAMEGQLQSLEGQFDQLKKGGNRPPLQDLSLAGSRQIVSKEDSMSPAPQSATRQMIHPAKQEASIADRLQALKQATDTADQRLPQPEPEVGCFFMSMLATESISMRTPGKRMQNTCSCS